jgi:cell division protease FtsH
MCTPSGLGMRHTEMNLQVTGTSLRRAEAVLREIRTLANERSVFRGQVISFGPDVFGPAAGSTPLSFLPRATVTREQLVLPAELLTDIERQVVGVAAHSRRLLASGQHLKRGVLLYGAPGTGKTHTVRCLLGLLPAPTGRPRRSCASCCARRHCSPPRRTWPPQRRGPVQPTVSTARSGLPAPS